VNLNRTLPWFLVVALGGGVVFALLSKSEAPAPISAAPAPAPLDSAGQAEPDDEPNPTGSASAAAAFPDETLVGVVREHFDVAQYTYLRLATDAGQSWAAVYRAPIKDGAAVTVIHASRLAKFHSRELNRDFDEIWFGMLPGYETAPATSAFPQGSSSAAGSAASMPAGPPPKGTTSIADLAKNAPSLDGKLVKVAGHVVKETDGILDRNWIHIQDGTGSAKDGSNDVLVTTDVAAAPRAIGDEVVVTGTVRTNQDFGAGYAYKFMLEKAALTARTR
jgi:hypothetical protein